MKLGIVGGGRAAWAFGSGWRTAGRPVSGIALREGSKSELPERLRASRTSLDQLAADSDLILVAVSDPAVAQVARDLGSRVAGGTVLFHASGSLGSEVLGLETAFSLHPLRSLPPVGTPVDLRGTLLVFEGPPGARELAREIARTLGGRFDEIDPAAKALYHAAAVMGSNHVAALVEAAADLLARCGLEESSCRPALASLAESAIANWAGAAAPERFTGPVARGDAATVERHLEALEAADPARAEIYRRLSAELASAVEKSGGATRK
ncbi:MAG TPA: DUF2520 domain-containing protein [Thermoanaerobaculia bacterium]|nr:DUF2520 domain-containing protein [Thermoanaerobaculia bacterium]